MATLPYTIPFTGFSHLGFLSCMAGVHAYLNLDNAVRERPNAWDYSTSPGAVQEDWYFTFGTMCGKNSSLERFEPSKNPAADQTEYADFCMKFAGYGYRLINCPEEFLPAVTASVEHGFPAIAVTCKDNDCRVIIGCEDGTLVFADPTGAQGDTSDPAPEDIREIYVITDRRTPEYSLLDGLKAMEKSLVRAIDDVWLETRSYFPEDFETWDGMYQKEPFEKTKDAFARLLHLMWNFDHCHNVSSTFAHKIHPELQDDRLAKLCEKIDGAYFDSHNMQWAMQSLYDLRDWEKREWCSKEFGMFLFTAMGLDRLRENDRTVLEAVREMIRILET